MITIATYTAMETGRPTTRVRERQEQPDDERDEVQAVARRRGEERSGTVGHQIGKSEERGDFVVDRFDVLGVAFVEDAAGLGRDGLEDALVGLGAVADGEMRTTSPSSGGVSFFFSSSKVTTELRSSPSVRTTTA